MTEALHRDALSLLGKRNLVFAIQEPSLPGRDEEDLGRGALPSRGTEGLLHWLTRFGFNGLQLGPMGITTPGNPSPYDASLFSRSPLGLALGRLVEEGRLDASILAGLRAARPPGATARADYDFVHRAQEAALAAVFERCERDPAEREETSRYLEANREWLVRDALWDVLVERHGSHETSEWRGTEGAIDKELFHPLPYFREGTARRQEALERANVDRIRAAALAQRLLEEQHAQARGTCGALGLKLYGDLQIGVSLRDLWAYAPLFLAEYRMGAPPSRTNPDGQPWNYAVLDPDKLGTLSEPGPALRFVSARMRRMLRDFDSVRIDHPHGWVCPWVYRAGTGDPLRAVQGGARLHESPDLPDHPELARYARVSPTQLDRAQPRHADRWVRELTPSQVEAYALIVDAIVEAAHANQRDTADLICEVLSTLPLPLEAVMKRHGLGRFRVLQKASLTNPDDVYRSENARAEDWVMIGNHDTPSIWELLPRWERDGSIVERARGLASRLTAESERERFTRHLLERPGRIAHALFADALASPASNAMLFFTDLFGLEEPYNVPGTVSPANWTLRLTETQIAAHAQLAKEDRALDLDRAMAWALGARKLGGALQARLLQR